MAQTLRCDLCGDEPGAAMVTMIDTGDVQVIGGNCMPAWSAGLCEAFNGQHQAVSTVAADLAGHPGIPNTEAGVKRVADAELDAHDDGSDEYAAAVAAAQTDPPAAVPAAAQRRTGTGRKRPAGGAK